jgi:hypothetical protein
MWRGGRTSNEAGPKEEVILVNHAEDGIHRSRNRTSAYSLHWRRVKRRIMMRNNIINYP